MQMVLDTEFGGMGETLYNLTALTGDARFAQDGRPVYQEPFRQSAGPSPRRTARTACQHPHSAGHCGSAAGTRSADDQRFRDVAEYFWQAVVGTARYVTGGTSNNEGWLVGPNQLAAELKLGDATNECCCSYNMLKLTRTLYEWTGDPRCSITTSARS